MEKISEEKFNSIFTSQDKYTFLAGAGISMNYPSNVPAAMQIVRKLLELCAPEQEVENIYSLDMLRYEVLIEYIKHYFDRELTFMEYFDLVVDPNSIHFFLATALLEKHYVITTNFDNLIEYAMKKTLSEQDHRKITPVITFVDFKNMKIPLLLQSQGKYPIYKIHGSNKNIITNLRTDKSLVTTISELGKGKEDGKTFGIAQFKKPAMINLLKGRKLVVMGYSGSDDFDIIPLLTEFREYSSLIWIEHSQSDDIEIFQFNKSNVSTQNQKGKIESILTKMALESPFEVFLIKANTANFLSNTLAKNVFHERLEITPSPPEKPIPDFPSWIEAKKSFQNIAEHKKWQFAWKIYTKFYDIDAQERTLNAGYEIAKKTDDTKAKSSFLHNLGYIYHIKYHDDKKAKRFFEKARKIQGKDKDYNSMAANYLNLGNLAFKQGKLEEALKHYQEIIPFIGEIAGEHREHTYNNIGLVYSKKGNSVESIKNYEKALKIANSVGTLSYKPTILTNLATEYSNQGQFEKAIEMQEEAIKIKKELGVDADRAMYINNLGFALQNQGRYRDAIKKYKQALEIGLVDNDTQILSIIYQNLGNSHNYLEEYEKAVSNFEKSLQMARDVGSESRITRTLIRLGKFHDDLAAMGIDFMKNLPIASQYIDEATTVAEKTKNKLDISECLMRHGLILIRQGNFKKAGEVLQKSLNIDNNYEFIKHKTLTLNAIGFLHTKQGDYKNAIPFFEEGLKFSKSLEYKLHVHESLGICYSVVKNRLKSAEHYKLAVKQAKSMVGKDKEDICKGAAAHQLVLAKKFIEATQLAKEVISNSENIHALAYSYLALGIILKFKEKKIKPGTKYLQKAKQYFIKKSGLDAWVKTVDGYLNLVVK